MESKLKIENTINKIINSENFEFEDIKFLLNLSNKNEIDHLYKKAYEIKKKFVGKKVYFRGIVEFSNICEKDCFYCGIRRSNINYKRYQLTEEEAVRAAMWAYENKFASIVIQAGERTDKRFVNSIENIVKEVKEKSNGELGITLSLGEQTEDVYKKWYDAGAHRYLLRLETSNRELYKKLHPDDHDFDRRVECIMTLKQLGFQTGTGVMIGLPDQTIDDLANDLKFMKEIDVDMIGMGPYIVHADTPMSELYDDFDSVKLYQLELALKMIAIARLIMNDINIASTTALQALTPSGRELGLLAGANIIMPNITDVEYRPYYQLYDDKPCINEGYGECNSCLQNRIAFLDEEIGYGEWGDSPHFQNKIK